MYLMQEPSSNPNNSSSDNQLSHHQPYLPRSGRQQVPSALPPNRPKQRPGKPSLPKWTYAISIGIALVLLFGCAAVTQDGVSTGTTTQTASNGEQTPAATDIPTTLATPAISNHVTPISGPAYLGNVVGTFANKYGQPNSHTQASSGTYDFSLYGDNQNDLSIQTLGGTDARVNGIIDTVPGTVGWSQDEAIAACGAFLPPDAQYQRQITTTARGRNAGIQRVYLIPSLASLLPAKDWTDETGEQTAPGTVGMMLGYF
jgi:hypothetical protein